MNFFESKNIILADATALRVKTALAQSGKIRGQYLASGQSMESINEALDKICPDFSKIDAYVICTGPGSVLGTRVASAAIATIAILNGSLIYEYDALNAAAFVVADKSSIAEFSILAPSRKGFVNLLNFENGKNIFENEIEITKINEFAKSQKYLLNQREKIDNNLADIERIDIALEQTFEILKRRPELAAICDLPPDAKSLTKREYVKWKAQVHI